MGIWASSEDHGQQVFQWSISGHMSRREWSNFSALAVRVCEEADGSGQEVLRGKQEWSELDRSGQGGLQE